MTSVNAEVALTPEWINSGIQRMFEDKSSEVGTYILTVKLLHGARLCMLNPYLPAQTRCLMHAVRCFADTKAQATSTLAFTIFMTV